jgi:hypothetical protein
MTNVTRLPEGTRFLNEPLSYTAHRSRTADPLLILALARRFPAGFGPPGILRSPIQTNGVDCLQLASVQGPISLPIKSSFLPGRAYM